MGQDGSKERVGGGSNTGSGGGLGKSTSLSTSSSSSFSPDDAAVNGLDPRIRNWLKSNAEYTVRSVEKDGGGSTSSSSSSSAAPTTVPTTAPTATPTTTTSVPTAASQPVSTTPLPSFSAVDGNSSSSSSQQLSTNNNVSSNNNNSATGSIITVSTGIVYKDKDPELVMLDHVEKLFPLYCSNNYRRLFPPELQAAKNHKLVMDSLPVLRLMAVYQTRYNVASLQVSTNQDRINDKVARGKVGCWQAMNKLARLGLDLNILEAHISEAWNIKSSIDVSRAKLLDVIKRTQFLVDLLPPDERSELPYPLELAAPLRKSNFISLNYLPSTPFGNPDLALDARILEDKLESVWVFEVIPHWDHAIVNRAAANLWRRSGVPPKLRSYVWKRIIGTKLHLSQQDFDNFVQHNGDYFNDKKVAITTIIEEEVQDAGATNATREQVSTPSSSPQPSSQVQQQQRQQLYDYYVPSELVFDVDPDMEAQFQQAQKAFWGNSTNDSDNNGDTDNANTATVPAPDATTQRQDRDLRTSMFASSRVIAPSHVEVMPDYDKLTQAKSVFWPTVDSGASDSGAVASTAPLSTQQHDHNHNQGKVAPHFVTRESDLKDLTKLIQLDLFRTLPKLKLFQEESSPAHQDAVHILNAVAHFRPSLGYVQGMTYLVGQMLLYMSAADTFVCLVNLLDTHFFASLCKFNLTEIERQTDLYQRMLSQNLPRLDEHFRRIHLKSRVWDCFLLEGPLFIHLTALGIIKLYEDKLLRGNFEECLNFLRKLPEEIDPAALFAAIDSLTVPPMIVHKVESSNSNETSQPGSSSPQEPEIKESTAATVSFPVPSSSSSTSSYVVTEKERHVDTDNNNQS